MPEVVPLEEALRILEAAAAVARSRKSVSELWVQRTRELAEMRSNKGAIAVLGTALLAKAVNPMVDALSLHERSGRGGYQARTLAREVLAANADRLRFALGTDAPDPLAGSPWFGPTRIDEITKWRRSAVAQADQFVGWLAAVKANEAFDALAAFLRVRMDVYRERAMDAPARAAASDVSLDDLL